MSIKKWGNLVGVMVVVGCVSGCATVQRTTQSMEGRDASRLRQMALSCFMYATDHNDMLPSSAADLEPYLNKETDLNQVDIVAKGKLSEIKDPCNEVLLKSQLVSRRGKRAVAFADGHVLLTKE